MTHVELYAFACKYGITGGLREVVLRKLRQSEVTLDSVEDLVDSVAAVASQYFSEGDALCAAVTEAVADRVPEFMDSDEFRKYVGLGGPFVEDLVAELGRRCAGRVDDT